VLVQVDGPVLGTPSAGGIDGSNLGAGAEETDAARNQCDRKQMLHTMVSLLQSLPPIQSVGGPSIN